MGSSSLKYIEWRENLRLYRKLYVILKKKQKPFYYECSIFVPSLFNTLKQDKNHSELKRTKSDGLAVHMLGVKMEVCETDNMNSFNH